MTTPVAIFTYNRPEHARKLFESLLICHRLEECDVYIFSDGAKKPEHEDGVRAAQRVAQEFIPRLKAKLIRHEQNLGLAHSIVGGVTDLCAQYGRVIVLEDDFILHPFFLDFMLQSLDCYADDERVAQVAGFTFPVKTPAKPDAYFLPLTSSWGWATWQRAWNLFSWDTHAAQSALEQDPQLRARFDLDGTYPYAEMLERAADGRVDSWAIRWYWQTFSANKLSLYPRRSLVWQNGFGELATHTTSARPDLQMSLDQFQAEKWQNPITFPDTSQVSPSTFDDLKSFLGRKKTSSLRSRLKRLLGRVRTWLVT